MLFCPGQRAANSRTAQHAIGREHIRWVNLIQWGPKAIQVLVKRPGVGEASGEKGEAFAPNASDLTTSHRTQLWADSVPQRRKASAGKWSTGSRTCGPRATSWSQPGTRGCMPDSADRSD